MKQEELSLQEPFELSLSNPESILGGNKIWEYIEHEIVFDEGLL